MSINLATAYSKRVSGSGFQPLPKLPSELQIPAKR